MEIDRIARNTNGEIGIFSRVVISLNKHFAVHNIDVQVMRTVFKIAVKNRHKICRSLVSRFAECCGND